MNRFACFNVWSVFKITGLYSLVLDEHVNFQNDRIGCHFFFRFDLTLNIIACNSARIYFSLVEILVLPISLQMASRMSFV